MRAQPAAQARMRCVDPDGHRALKPVEAAPPEGGNLSEKPQPNPQALPLWQNNKAAGARLAQAGEGCNRQMGHIDPLGAGEIEAPGDHIIGFQVVMRLKGGPMGAVGLVDFDLKAGAPSKTAEGQSRDRPASTFFTIPMTMRCSGAVKRSAS